jgi:EpsD family peptidyl-prolyl cis-trans isomerase
MLARPLLVAALSLVPAGCQRAAADHAAVLARVNGSEISLASIAPAVGPAVSAAGTREALEKVIDRELLVQRALQLRLDREPQVAAALDAARRQVLAQAYVERLAAGAAGEVPRERVHAFYAENPALFAERRIYRLREVVVSAPAELLDVLRTEAARARSLEELTAWLRTRDARFSVAALAQPAEELPLAWLPRLARMKPGEIAVFLRPAYAGTPGGASVVRLEHADEAPLDEAQATPLIERFLAGRRRLEVAAAEVRRLREAAHVEYTGQLKP